MCPEVRKEVKTYRVEYLCPQCKLANLKWDGLVLASNPPQYNHACPNTTCTFVTTFVGKKYPYTKYEVVDSLDKQKR